MQAACDQDTAGQETATLTADAAACEDEEECQSRLQPYNEQTPLLRSLAAITYPFPATQGGTSNQVLPLARGKVPAVPQPPPTLAIEHTARIWQASPPDRQVWPSQAQPHLARLLLKDEDVLSAEVRMCEHACVRKSMKSMPTCYSCPVQAEGVGSRQNASVFFPLPGDLDVEE